MIRPTRRTCLRAAVLATSGAIAGCLGRGNEDGGSNTPEYPGRDFAVTASMLQQQSDVEPPRVQFRLENESSEPTTIRYGTTVFIPEERLPWINTLELDDDSYHGYSGPETPRNGCWQSETWETPTMGTNERTIESGSALEKTYWILTAPGKSACYPPDGYRFATAIEDAAGEFVVELQLTVTDDGQIEADGRGPRPVL